MKTIKNTHKKINQKVGIFGLATDALFALSNLGKGGLFKGS